MNAASSAPIAIACVVSLLMGMARWLDHARAVDFLGQLAMGLCGLLWLMADARRRGVAVGEVIGVITLVAQPLGLAAWFYRHWKWRCYIPLLVYGGIVLLQSACMFSGFVAFGLTLGVSIAKLIRAF